MPRALMLCLLLLTGCVHDPKDLGLEISDQHNLAEPKIQFLGVGGWLLHWQGEGLLLAPSFSNPAFLGIKGIPPLRVVADAERIDRYMPPADDVSMLLVGHAHYDHLLDVPRVVSQHAPNATVYGSETVAHILRGAEPPITRVVVPRDEQITSVGKPQLPGTWFYSSGKHIRAMPIESMHAGHIFGINLLPGSYDHDLSELPSYVGNWNLGKHTLAWLIDLLDANGNPVYRIHYQDSAAQPPYGFPPLLSDGKGIDVEILCAGSWDQVSQYPGSLLNVTKPRLVIVGHWENFFGNDPLQPQTIPGQSPVGMLDAITKSAPQARVVVPAPLSEVALPAPQ